MTASADTELDVLMARLADGDRAAFTPVFQTLWPPVVRFCRSILRSEADAADAAQQALEKIFERASQYDPSRPAMPWALAIAAWECRTILRKRARRHEVRAEATVEAAAGVDVEGELSQRELALDAVAALEELSESDRQVLVATFWEEGALEGGPAVRKRRERALTRLRVAWKRLYGL